ncbi:MAG: DUF192 domain-containing protein [Candidatus Elulimicrobiales bacterium]|nr:DUF192 domain-containing protein [Candidatus Elulimicrobiales bacterium]
MKAKAGNANFFTNNEKFASNENIDESIILDVENLSEDKGNSLITKNGDKIFLEIANTPESRAQGLSGKTAFKTFEENEKLITEGMLFVFDKPETSSFWMKDMNFDLDIIWLDESFNIVHIEKALASSYNSLNPDASQTFSNGANLAKYVLEVKMGTVERFNLKVGDVFECDRIQL